MTSNSLKSTFNMTMWSASNIDLRNVDLIVEQFRRSPAKFEPTPYTFTKIENGKKITAETSCFNPPTWLMLDHAIAVIWSLFSQKAPQQLTIDDLKWAYEFLKQIKNKKGENPPDVKVCLKEIQDRLISQYARLTSLQDEDFDEIAAAFGEKIISESTSDCVPFMDCKSERTVSQTSAATVVQTQSTKDVNKGTGAKPKKSPVNYLMQTYPIIEDDYESNIFEDPEDVPDEEVEKYILTLFDDEKKQDAVQVKSSVKSMIPTAKKTNTQVGFLNGCPEETVGDAPNREKSTKKVRCVAEMRSVKFQKSTKVQDNGEAAAYSNLKAEIRRLTINPNVSRDEIMKFLKDWRSEQVDRLHNELKRLNSIEEFMKNLGKDQGDASPRARSPLKIKEIKTTKTVLSKLRKFTT